jgi:hypothetical protein
MKKLPLTKQGLEFTDLKNDMVAYCPERNQAYALNPTATKVLNCCRRKASVAEALEALGDGPEAEELLHCTLASLADKGLVEKLDAVKNVSRREFLARWGVAAAAFPVVGAAFIPPAASAQSMGTMGTMGTAATA